MNLRHDVGVRQPRERAKPDKRGANSLSFPGDPGNSYIVHKVKGNGGSWASGCPRAAQPYLTPGQILIIKRWIELGAKND